jgi:hypothetical protein
MTHFTEGSEGAADQKTKNDQEPIQLDLYGVKVRFSPPSKQREEPSPGSWAEVAHQVHQDLKAIAVGLIRLVRIAIEGTANLVAGISALPNAFANKVQKGHHRSDELEREQQERERDASDRDATEAQRRISALLSRKMIEGNVAGIATDSSDEFLVVYVLKPDAEVSVPSLVQQAGAALRLSGGLAEIEGSKKMLQRSPLSKEWFRFFSILNQGQHQLTRALSETRLSTDGRDRIYISSADHKTIDLLRSLLGQPAVKRDFEAAIQTAFGSPLKWSIIFEDGSE